MTFYYVLCIMLFFSVVFQAKKKFTILYCFLWKGEADFCFAQISVRKISFDQINVHILIKFAQRNHWVNQN